MRTLALRTIIGFLVTAFTSGYRVPASAFVPRVDLWPE